MNGFWKGFLPFGEGYRLDFQKEAKLSGKGVGEFLFINIENVDDFYQGPPAEGLKPLTEPQNSPSGKREFVIRDPDRYELVFFKRK